MLLLFFFPLHGNRGEALRKVNWASFALGLAILGLEIGFLLPNRAGWDLSLAGIATNAAAGVLLFKEKPSPINVFGAFMCILGIIMVNWKK